MKKVFLILASIMMQVVTAQFAYGQTVLTDPGIHDLGVSNEYGHRVTFNMFVDMSSSIWSQGTYYGDLVFHVQYGPSPGNLYNVSEEEEINPLTGGGSSESNDDLVPGTQNYYRIVVYREDNPFVQWISETQSIQSFNSGQSARASAVVLGADTVKHHSAGPVRIVVSTPDFPGQYYHVQYQACDESGCGNYEYLPTMQSNSVDTFEFTLEGEPGEFVSGVLRVGNSQVGYVYPNWGTFLKPESLAAVTVSVPVPNNGNTEELVAHGTITYGGSPTNQWFGVTGPEPVYGMMGPINRLNYTGELTEVFDKPNTPGVYTLTHYADNDMGLNQVSVEFEILDPTGIDDISAEDIAMFPNPTNGDVTLGSPEPTSYEITSVDGRIVATGYLDGRNQESVGLDVSPGLYLVSLIDLPGVPIKKLIVR